MKVSVTDKTQAISLVVIALVLAAVVAVAVFTNGSSSTPTKSSQARTAGSGVVKYISGALDRSVIEQLGQARELPEMFWLGPPQKGQEIVTDRRHRDQEVQLAYLDKSAQKALAAGHVTFSILIITQPLAKSGTTIGKLEKLSSKEIRRPGMTAYLPPRRYLGQHRFFVVSDDHKWGGIVDYGSRSTMARAEAIARRLQVLRVPSD